MTDELNMQLSAFVDGELSPEESELLVRRLCRDESLRDTAAFYAMIGDSLRGEAAVTAPADFARRVMMAVDGQAVASPKTDSKARTGAGRQWGFAIAASAVLAVVALMTLPDRLNDETPVALAGDPVNVPDAPAGSAATSPLVVADATATPAVDMLLGDARVLPSRFDVPLAPADRQSPENRARLNNYLLMHVSEAGMTRQGLAPYRNVGFIKASSEQ